MFSYDTVCSLVSDPIVQQQRVIISDVKRKYYSKRILETCASRDQPLIEEVYGSEQECSWSFLSPRYS